MDAVERAEEACLDCVRPGDNDIIDDRPSPEIEAEGDFDDLSLAELKAGLIDDCPVADLFSVQPAERRLKEKQQPFIPLKRLANQPCTLTMKAMRVCAPIQQMAQGSCGGAPSGTRSSSSSAGPSSKGC